MTQPFTKAALTYSDQVRHLEQRGMVIADRAQTEHALASTNYYRLAAYWRVFEADHSTHRFRPGVTFEDVLSLYTFDQGLRRIVMDGLEQVEVAVRARWAYELAHRHGPHAHLNGALHLRYPGKYVSDRMKLEKEVQRATNAEAFIPHFIQHYSEPLPPIWAICEVMSFGSISRWYDNLSDDQARSAIARPFGLNHHLMASWLHHLTTVRNTCAHHARLWNREFVVTPAEPTSKSLAVTALWSRADRRLYNTLLILLHLVNRVAPGHKFGSEVVTHVTSRQLPGGFRAMGFPRGSGVSGSHR